MQGAQAQAGPWDTPLRSPQELLAHAWQARAWGLSRAPGGREVHTEASFLVTTLHGPSAGTGNSIRNLKAAGQNVFCTASQCPPAYNIVYAACLLGNSIVSAIIRIGSLEA